MVQLARRIIQQKTGPFDEAELTGDRYQQALHDLVARKMKGEKPIEAAEPAAGNVINLMDALRRSLDADERKPAAPSRRKAERAPRQRRTTKARRTS
jgi:DNA end-binding protein Ku